MFFHYRHPLRYAAPDDGGGATPSFEPPSAAKTAAKGKTAKPPAQVDLEKRLSSIEDRQGTVESALDGINNWLSSTFPKTPSPNAPSKSTATKGFFDGVFDDLL